MSQPALFDIQRRTKPARAARPPQNAARAKAARDTGIANAGKHANDKFIEAAYLAILTVIRQQETFIIDDVWTALGPNGPDTHERRAIAAAIGRARREKRIAPTGTYRPSSQPQCHANPRQVWRRV